jgi:Thiol-activated cytolysin
MKKYSLAILVLFFTCPVKEISAQVKKTTGNFSALTSNTNLSWFIAAKSNFLKSQKQVSSGTAIATKNISTGKYLEMSTTLLEGSSLNAGSSSNKDFEGGKVSCKETNNIIDLSLKPEFNILKASSQTKIFPGVIFTAASVLDESLTPPTGLPARKPMTLNISLPGATQSSVVLDNPGTVQLNKINELIQNNNGRALPAMVGASITEVDSKFEFAAAVEASSGVFLPLEEFGIPAEVNAGTQFSGNVGVENKKHTYILKYIQPMFILAHNDFNSSNIFQDPNAAASRTNAVMVNSVTYGRMVFIKIVSEETGVNVKTAAQAKLGIQLTELNIKAGNSFEGTGSTNFNTIVKEFKAIILGGNAATANRVITDPNQLKNYLTDASANTLTAQTGAIPISFTLVRVSDYASVGIRSVADFKAITDCVLLNEYDINIKNFGVEKVVDNPLAGNNEDIFGSVTVKAYYKDASGTTRQVPDIIERPSEVWSKTSGNVVQLKEGEYFYFGSGTKTNDGSFLKRTFRFRPEQLATGYIVMTWKLNDKIMQDGEQLGNSAGSVAYETFEKTIYLRDWKNIQDASGFSAVLQEKNGDAKIGINFSAYVK